MQSVYCYFRLQGKEERYSLGACPINELRELVINVNQWYTKFPGAKYMADPNTTSGRFVTTASGTIAFEIVFAEAGPEIQTTEQEGATQ